MHQHQPLHFRLHHLANRGQEAACPHRPPALPARETADNIAAAPASRSSPAPPVKSSLLLPKPSCNKISGEDLRLRGSSRASFRACASSTYSTLGGTPFFVFITSERSLLLHEVKHNRSRRIPCIFTVPRARQGTSKTVPSPRNFS